MGKTDVKTELARSLQLGEVQKVRFDTGFAGDGSFSTQRISGEFHPVTARSEIICIQQRCPQLRKAVFRANGTAPSADLQFPADVMRFDFSAAPLMAAQPSRTAKLRAAQSAALRQQSGQRRKGRHLSGRGGTISSAARFRVVGSRHPNLAEFLFVKPVAD